MSSTGRKQQLVPDTHTHLGDEVFDADRDEVIVRARRAGIDRILVVGTDLASSRKAVELAQTYDAVYAAVGVHPHQAAQFRAEADELRTLLAENNVVAVGEVGLDYLRPPIDRAQQVDAFEQQLSWALEGDLPVSVHQRAAQDDVLAGLRRYPVRAILHCFEGSADFLAAGLELGCMISFAGNLTFLRASALREVAVRIPADRLLVETDSPVLAPVPWRGRRNEPAHVQAVVDQLAALRGVSPEEMAETVRSNADSVFGWSAA